MKQLKISNKITIREGIALDKYLNDISKIDLISADDEIDLAKRIREWDQEALESLIEANLRFVVSVAKQYQNQWLSLSDLINEWNVWLMKAAKRFDETRWFKFISYAVRRIRQSILQAIWEKSRIVRLPINRGWSYQKLNEAGISFMQEFNREPTDEELSELLDISKKYIVQIKNWWSRHISFDAPVIWDDTTSSLIDIFEDKSQEKTDYKLNIESCSKDIANALLWLSGKQQEVINLYFWLNWCKKMSLEDIWDNFGLSRERVRQIKDEAISKLRRSWSKDVLKSYLR